MAGIIESLKKLYNGKNATKNHIILFAICAVYIIGSTLFDTVIIGNPNNIRQNPFDIIFGVLIGVYSLQYIHNSIHNIVQSGLPSISEINPKSILPYIGISWLWGAYIFIAFLIAAVTYYWTKSIIPAVILIGLLVAIAGFYIFIQIGLADRFKAKKLMDITLIFKFIKPAFKPFWLATFKSLLISAGFAIVYLGIYFIAGLFDFSEKYKLATDFYAFDAIMLPLFVYSLIIVWYFVYPYMLIDTYKEKIRPIIGFDSENTIESQGENQ